MSTDTEINTFLYVIEQKDSNKKWSVFYNADKEYWTAEYKGITPPCKINLETTEQFVYMQANVGDFHIHTECSSALWFYLLRLNEDLPLVKFGLLGNGAVALMAELPLDVLSLNSFETVIRLMVDVFAQYRREIELLASDSELAKMIAPEAQASVRPPIKVVQNSN